jgi:hypothetical protein
MFRALQCQSSGDRQTAITASGFRMNVEVGVFSAVVGLLVGRQCVSAPPTHTVSPLSQGTRLFAELYFLNYTWYVNDLHNI